jgi:hypothetical protein
MIQMDVQGRIEREQVVSVSHTIRKARKGTTGRARQYYCVRVITYYRCYKLRKYPQSCIRAFSHFPDSIRDCVCMS